MIGRRQLAAGTRLAFTTFTVVPVRATGGLTSAPDRVTAGVAMSVAPAVGAVLGVVLAAVALGGSALRAAPLVAAVVTVAAGALMTRGLHLDGLADTVDGLGSYRDADGALAIMRRPDVGPFGVAALILVLVGQVVAIAEIISRAATEGGWTSVLGAIVAATAAGRLAITAGCRRGVPPARPSGLGAAVAGTVGPVALLAGGFGVVALAVAAVPGRPWQGPVAVVIGLAAAGLLRRHAVRRLGGITGDVLGALCELTATVTYLAMSI